MRLGRFLDPDQIFKCENHDEAYYIWRKTGVSERILLHIDAHHDMYGSWPVENRLVTISNFILPALQENMLREVVWVVSDETWAGRSGRNDIRRIIETLRRNGIAGSHVHEGRTIISTTVFGRPLTICTIGQLPTFYEPVLLDVDVDFFVIPNIGYRGASVYSRLPWVWPRELVTCLFERKIRTDLVTVAYSVEGGFTPLQWKYLGDELALRLQRIEDSRALDGMDFMRLAACAGRRGDFSAAANSYLKAKTLLPQSAAPDFHLAHLYAARGLTEIGRAHYREAVALDDSYRTAFNSSGLAHYVNGRWKASRAAHTRTLLLDESDPYAHLGLGLLSLRTKSWRQARKHFCRTLQFDESNIDAIRGLGAALVGERDSLGAIGTYERSLKYALRGRRSLLDGMIASSSRAHPIDLDHWQMHVTIAGLYARTGEWVNALAGYRMGIAAGKDGIGIRIRLAHLLFRAGDNRKGMAELVCAFGQLPLAMRFLHSKVAYLLKRLFADGLRVDWLIRVRKKPELWI